MTLARWCRAAAIVIAVAAVVDPSLTLARSARPTVALIDTGAAASVVDRIARSLMAEAVVVRGETPDASAMVVVGHRLPAFASDVTTPTFVIRPDGPAVEIDRLSGPSHSPIDARAPFVASVHVTGARAQTLSVGLSADGILLDRVDRAIAGDDARVDVPVTFVPSTVGPARIRVTATLSGSIATASADTITRVERSPWAVFAFDPRPAWMSTFVRRALEGDNRFAVTGRTVTSRSVATSTPGAPHDLGNPTSLDRFDAIVVGAPDALTAGDVASLEAYLSRRDGAVILLWDVRPTGPAVGLTGVERWQFDTRAADRGIAAAAGTLRASDLAWPARLPIGADVVGLADATSVAAADSTHPAAAIWRADHGAGRVVVSGALDAWRYRDAPQSAFDAVWRQIVADAAEASPAPLAIRVTPAVARPGETLTIHAIVRDAELAAAGPAAAGTAASIQSAMALKLIDAASGLATTLRAWPDGAPGRFAATTSAPAPPGRYVIDARSGSMSATADLVVDPAAGRASAGESDALAAWAASRGGRVVSESATADVAAAIRRLAPSAAAPAPTHPMRSPWWIAPMTLLLGIEWLTRRRKGLK